MNKQKPENQEQNAPRGKAFVGKVVNAGMHQTVIVEVASSRRHPLYMKAVRRTRRFPAHTTGTELLVGDMVEIVETRPMSKTKHFVVRKKLS